MLPNETAVCLRLISSGVYLMYTKKERIVLLVSAGILFYYHVSLVALCVIYIHEESSMH